MNENQESTNQGQIAQPAKRSRKKIVIIASVVSLLLIAVLGYGASRLYLQNTQSSDVVGHQSLANDGNKIITKEEGDIANVVDRVGPSVVSIVTTATVNARFGAPEEVGAGTGIIVGKDGYILTNKHVVTGANKVGVVLCMERSMKM